ncbi:hypothetical protein O181_089247, partial [Austropuccinia psidii MF-1]|nr:hypothetical protein [Austropuccinia psidii MF-1]
TKPDSAHNQNYLKHDEAIIAPLDVMVRTKPNIEHHEDNNTKSNHKKKLTQSQRQHTHDSKQIMSHLGHSYTEYKNFSAIFIDKKSANASWLKLPSLNTLPHPYILIDKNKKPFLPVIIYEITPFDNSFGHCQMPQNLLMKLRKSGLNPHQIETDNNQWTKLQQYDKFVYLRISHFSKLAANENQSLTEAARLTNFSQLEWTSANPKEEFKSFTDFIVAQDGFFNKPHQDLNDLNAWTDGIFSFVSKKYFHPLPTVFTPSGHGLHFLELKMEINFSKKPGIMEILWKTSTIVHHTTKPLQEILNND